MADTHSNRTVIRLNEFKGAFGSTTDWKEWSQEMEDYCIQDVNVTTKLWKHFQPLH